MQEDIYRGDGLNLYAYCRNNPVMYYDPSGYGSEGSHPDVNKEDGIDSQSTTNQNKIPSELSDPNVNVYYQSDDTMQRAMDTITQASQDRLTNNGEKPLFSGGPRQTITVTPEGSVILTQNNSAVNIGGREAATQIFGDKVIPVGGGKDTVIPNMEGTYGGHSEAKGIQYLEKNDIPTEGTKQYSSHNSCGSCEKLQDDHGVYNGTGVQSEEGKQVRTLNPYDYEK